MGALTIAFDTTIVGALALSWVLLIIHLFFLPGEDAIQAILEWVGQKQLQVVAGVLLFAMTFTLGSAVSRMAQDFFNDDDLNVPQVLRMAMTEDRMVASVYCSMDKGDLLRAGAGDPALKEKIDRFQCLRTNCCVAAAGAQPAAGGTVAQSPSTASSGAQKSDCCSGAPATAGATGDPVFVSGSSAQTPKPICPCDGLLSPRGQYVRNRAYWRVERRVINTARDIFGLQENALLLKGEDSTQRLRQFHDQIMVLRGATYDGLVTLALCVFGWGVDARDKKHRIRRWLLGLFPWFLVFLGVSALYEHYIERAIEGPPYMEFSLLVLGGAGVVLLWFPRVLPRRARDRDGKEKPQGDGILLPWAALTVLFGVLVVGGLLGWWATEVLYAQRVIYSYDAMGAVGK